MAHFSKESLSRGQAPAAHRQEVFVTEQSSDGMALQATLRELHKVRVTAIDRNGNRTDVSINGRDSSLVGRRIHGIAETKITTSQDGSQTLTIKQDKSFNGRLEITLSNGTRHEIRGALKLPKITPEEDLPRVTKNTSDKTTQPQQSPISNDLQKTVEASRHNDINKGATSSPHTPQNDATQSQSQSQKQTRTLDPSVKQSIELKVEVEGISALPIRKEQNPELFNLASKAKALGAEIVVVKGQEEKFAYEIRRDRQVAAKIEIPTAGSDFHERRNKALSESLTRTLQEPKAKIEFNGKEIEFSRLQSPELHASTQKLNHSGMQLSISLTEGNQCEIRVKDSTTGYLSNNSVTMSYEALREITRGQKNIPENFKQLLNAHQSRSDLLLSEGAHVTKGFNDRVRELLQKAPEPLTNLLLEKKWTIATNEMITPLGTYKNDALNERTPVGRCIYSQKEIQLAEYSMRGEKAKNDPVHAVYHEMGHVVFQELSDGDKLSLQMALERDKNQLGTNLSAYQDKNDRELSLKLEYYGNLTEGVPECIEGLIDPASSGGKVMPVYYPNLFKATQEALARSGILPNNQDVLLAKN